MESMILASCITIQGNVGSARLLKCIWAVDEIQTSKRKILTVNNLYLAHKRWVFLSVVSDFDESSGRSVL